MRKTLAGAAAVLAVLPGAAPAPAAPTICVGVVVDFGDDGPYSPTRTCVVVPEDATGAEVLAARAKQLHRPAPRYEGNFLCGIDGFPKDDCATRATGSEYEYWSYWHQVDGEWEYSNLGAVDYVVEDTDGDGNPDLEGWHYISSTTAGNENAPGGTASYEQICPKQPSKSPAPSRSPSPTRAAVVADPQSPIRTAGTPSPATTTPAAPARSRVSVAATPSPTPSAVVAEPAAQQRRLPVGSLAGVALVGVLGAAAMLRSRR